MKKVPTNFLPDCAQAPEASRRQFLVRSAATALCGAIPLNIQALAQSRQQRLAITPSGPVRIQVSSRIQHTMAGGMGASWHAIGPTAYFYGTDSRNIKGSAWGGTPPANYAQQWDDMQKHFQWLGLDFVRVELEMRMYEPERGIFDWQNDEMKMLHRILDTCQKNHSDVFLTQMWQDVEWNTIDGTPTVSSAPKSVPDFAAGLGTLVEHLVHDEGYTCIRWLCITNEPADDWGWWLGPNRQPQNLMPAIQAVRAELDRRKIPVAISGPDFIYEDNFNSPIFDWEDSAVGAFDLHYYSENDDISMDWIKTPIQKARARGIPIFLSEFGSYVGGSLNGSEPAMMVCADYPNQLLNAEKVLLGLNLGMDGFNRWSFTNRGDLDGQWQLVRTWDPVRWNYFPRVTPEPIPYYAYGILTRYVAKHSNILAIELANELVLASALLSPSGNLTVIVLNKSGGSEELLLSLAENTGKQDFYKYQVEENTVKNSN